MRGIDTRPSPAPINLLQSLQLFQSDAGARVVPDSRGFIVFVVFYRQRQRPEGKVLVSDPVCNVYVGCDTGDTAGGSGRDRTRDPPNHTREATGAGSRVLNCG
jgi:hypothetical protein